jgi:hypothetical protein
MVLLSPTFTSLLISASLVFTYLWVRCGWVRILPAIIVGTMTNSLCFFLFALSRGNGLTQAIITSLILGAFFTAVSVAMANQFAHAVAVKVAPEEKVLVTSKA